MDKMVLGAYTFSWNPEKCTVPRETKSSSVVETYGGAVYFSWGTLIAGQKINLEWDWLQEAQWDELQTLLEADAEVVWDPQTGPTYNVEIAGLKGDYQDKSLIDADYRRNVVLSLVIISEV